MNIIHNCDTKRSVLYHLICSPPVKIKEAYNTLKNTFKIIKLRNSGLVSYKSILLTLIFNYIFLFTVAQYPKREMRGVWVASVLNLDWPSEPGLKSKKQKKEVDAIIKRVKTLGLNAIFLQVRPCSDALYNSEVEPWSRYISGTQDKAPQPYYDPLKYWIHAAHKMGIEVHAWINPYRITMNKADQLAPTHPALKHPDKTVEYGEKLYFDPGFPEVQQHINKVIVDLITNYNIDGIHMDDYFYPYPISDVDFPDTISHQLYYDSLRFETIDDWRRDNVDKTVRSIHLTIKNLKPWVAFGISPFGVWRNIADDPAGSNTSAGITNYDHLYADVLLWMKNGWVDYVVPQIYWEMDHPTVGFKEVSQWWNTNSYNTQVYIGHGIYKINSGNQTWQNPSEMPEQIRLVRQSNNLSGNIYFRYNFLKHDLLGLQDTLKNYFYSIPALTPIVVNGSEKSSIKINKIRKRGRRIVWDVDRVYSDSIKGYVVYSHLPTQKFSPDSTKQITSITGSSSIKLKRQKGKQRMVWYFRVSVIDKYGNEWPASSPIRFKL